MLSTSPADVVLGAREPMSQKMKRVKKSEGVFEKMECDEIAFDY